MNATPCLTCLTRLLVAATPASAAAGMALADPGALDGKQFEDGRPAWKGVIRNGKLDATATMLHQGKPPVENWVVATIKP